MILEIVKYPDARLRKKSGLVAEITPEIRQLADDMLETMYAAKGIGLAAPQIGRNLRMIVMDHSWQADEASPRVLINPVLELLGEKINSEKEGCLSVPLGFRADVARHSEVRVTGLDIDGQPVDELLRDLPAIIAQHEVDHLDGTLFIDYLAHLRRSMYDTKVKKWLKSKDFA